MAPGKARGYLGGMKGSVFISLVVGLMSGALGVERLLTAGVSWASVSSLAMGVMFLIAAFIYWRGSHAQGS
jgi:hypothetical protein